MKALYFLPFSFILSTAVHAQSELQLPTVEVRTIHWLFKPEANKLSYQLSAQENVAGSDLWYALRFVPALSLEAEGLRLQGKFIPALAVNGRLVRLSDQALEGYLQSIPAEEVEAIEIVHNTMGEYPTQEEYVLNVRRRLSRVKHFSGFNTLSGNLQGFVSEQLNGRLSYGSDGFNVDLSYGGHQQRSAREVSINHQKEEEWVAPLNGGWGQADLELRLGSRHTFSLGANYERGQEDLKYDRGPRAAFEREGWMGYAGYVYTTPRLKFRLAGEGQQQLSQRYYRLRNEKFQPYREAQVFMGIGRAELAYRLSEAWRIKMATTAHYNKYQGVEVKPYTGLIRPELDWRELNVIPQFELNYDGALASLILGTQVAFDTPEPHYALGHTHTYWLPYAHVAYRPYEAHRLDVDISSTLQHPSFRDLNPFSTSNGILLTYLGSSDLSPTTTHRLSFRYTYRNMAFIEWQSAYVEKPLVQTINPSGDGIFVLQPTNWAYSMYTRLSAYAPIPIVRRKSWSWRSDVHVAWHWQDDFDAREGNVLSRHFPSYFAQIKQVFNLPCRWSADVGATYYSPLYWGEWKMQTQWWLSASLSKRWDNWRVALSVHDPLHTQVFQMTKDIGTPLVARVDGFTPRVSLGVTWTWGKSRKSSPRLVGTEYQRIQQTGSEGLRLP